MVPLMLLAMRASNNGSIVGEWCIAMPFGSKKGGKKGEPKGIRVSAVATTRKVIMATGAELRDCTMGWKGNGEWSEMKHELATLGGR